MILAMENVERIATVRARIVAAEERVRALKLERKDRYVLLQGFRRLRDDVGSGRFKITSSLTLVEEAKRRGSVKE